ncbi:MAG TPA: RNA polymerase sigma factor, partial [Blastocatellia bacterium]|nr:RNA polymerase sigma factor [Blastocatellia bacterium]
MLKPWRGVAQNHEDLFIERYRRLLGVSLKLTGHNREQAEDLLHDAFIQFTLNRPDIDNIQNLEGYLYAMLRNMHLSNLRRVGRSHGHPVSLVEYDSAEVALLAVSHHVLISARDELRAICSYACWRKDTSKVGTVLTLRFFHGYYPGEIAQIIRSPRKAVDDWLHLGRREARAYMADPGRIHSIKSPRGGASIPIEPAMNTAEFLASLRDTIFRSCQGECLSPEQLREVYTGPESESLTSKTLAHVVSCRTCLDEVNRLLKLDPLADRFPTDMIGPDAPSGGGRSGHSSDERGFARTARRRSRQVFEHEPRELRVAVNGFVLGSQSIGSEFNEQTINVNLSERIGFVEVFSEQDVRLLFFNVEPAPDGPIEQIAHVKLSEGRSLEVSLEFDNTWPRIRALYHDPSLSLPVESEEGIYDHAAAREIDGLSLPKPERLPRGRLNIRERLRGWTSPFGLLLRPGAITAGLALILIAIMVLLKLPAPAVSAAELLRRSSAAEGSLAETPETAFRRMITVEELRNGGRVTARRRVEVWSSGEHGLKVRRVYDEKDQLIAGEWTQSDGTRTVYTVGAKPQLSSQDSGPLELIVSELNQYWRMEPSATQFLSLVTQPELAHVEERADVFVVDYKPPQSASDPALVHAMIMLRKPDLHPIENRLEFLVFGELREYRLAESSFERRAIHTIAPKVFEPEPELRGLRGPGRASGAGRVEPESPLSTASASARLSPAMLVELETDALYRLHQLGSCMREQPLLGRTPEGGLQIDIIVDGEKRKAEL